MQPNLVRTESVPNFRSYHHESIASNIFFCIHSTAEQYHFWDRSRMPIMIKSSANIIEKRNPATIIHNTSILKGVIMCRIRNTPKW